MSERCCPACRADTVALADWPFGGLGESVFNYVAAFRHCTQCGLVYVANIDDARLARFYHEECAYHTSAHFAVDRPENIAKARRYLDFIAKLRPGFTEVTDIGCGRGGFLRLARRSHPGVRVLGIDIAPGDPEARAEAVMFAAATSAVLPLANDSQSLLTCFHVLEHLRVLDSTLEELARVLQPGGLLVIEVPDAERYAETPIGPAYWLAIREHVQHITPCALTLALARHGLHVEHLERGVLPTPEFRYASLLLAARKAEAGEDAVKPGRCVGCVDYLQASARALECQAEWVAALRARHGGLTFWGCSAELLSLLPRLDTDVDRLCDANPLKQRQGYRGRVVYAPELLAPRGALVIAPYLYAVEIRRAAVALGWRPEQIFELGAVDTPMMDVATPASIECE
ncbi:class I SAM-dependent methyltransferase [Marichromatium gracile]|uniref:Methyltransferase family protein n=1 Tax=Marichromatium gracile TaxID=1048 RepID=A0A4R4AB45_MARGR|nr:class I SAM-dependent methyltransferase [Marichromatium gracile]MBK1709319.1 hypothetical protein [Marichromatium gracile]TCW36221.1 methyltransferase family protein [Marichromatium gracile]